MQLLTGFYKNFIDQICCSKVEYLNLKYEYRLTTSILKFTKQKCANSKQSTHSAENKLRISKYKILMKITTIIKGIEQKYVQCASANSKGE